MTGRHARKLIFLFAAGSGIVLGGLMTARFVRADGRLARDLERRTLIDARTGRVFEDLRVPRGAGYPLEHPETGEPTLFPAERCHWTADGGAKLEPTYVLLNVYTGSDEPTACPDCGRPVVAHNPLPPDELMIEAAERDGGG